MKQKAGEYSRSILSAVIIALLIRAFVIEAFKIPSGSMIPSLLIGDHLFVNRFIYGLHIPFTRKHVLAFHHPERGDVVVFVHPEENKDLIKRVVGLPGDRVRTEGEALYINGEKVPHTVTSEAEGMTVMTETLGDTQYNVQYTPYRSFPDRDYLVPPDHLFVMGDNRDNSADGREWGFLPLDNLKGKAMFVWLSCGEPNRPPETSFEKGLERVRSTISDIPVIGWFFPCDGHWLSIRWDRFGHWIK